MKRLIAGAVVTGVAMLGLRAAARHGRDMCAGHCGGSNANSQRSGC